MSKARITYRFEHPRSAAGQAQAEPVKRKSESERERGWELTNTDLLKHMEFEYGDDPVVVEETPEPAARTTAADLYHLNGYPHDYGAWNEPVVRDSDELERLIRQSAPSAYERRRRGERGRGQAPYAAPSVKEDERYELEPYDAESGYWPSSGERSFARLNRGKKEGPTWWKFAVSVVGAMATGVLFGTFMLNLFAGQAEDGGRTAELAPPPAAGEAQAPPAVTPDLLDEPAIATVSLPARRMFLLQNGVFQTLEGARELADSMKEKGLAATIEQGQSFFVYAAVTSDRDAALRAGRKLQEAGVEIYVKPYELPAVAQVRWSTDGSAEALGQYMTQGSRMVQMIGDVTMIHLEGDAPVAPESGTLAALKSEHLRLTEVTAAAMSGLPAEAQPVLKRMDAAIRTAVVAIEEYAAHPAHAYLWSAQSALMDYIIAEKQLLTTIATQ